MTETQRQAAAEWIDLLRERPLRSSAMRVRGRTAAVVLRGLHILGAPITYCARSKKWSLDDKSWRIPPVEWSRVDLLADVLRLRPNLHPLNVELDRLLGPLP